MAITGTHARVILRIVEMTYIAELIENTLAKSDAEIEADLRAWGIDLDKFVEDFREKLYHEYAKRRYRPRKADDRWSEDETTDQEQWLRSKAEIQAVSVTYRSQRKHQKERRLSTHVRDSIKLFFENHTRKSEEEIADILAYLECCYSDKGLAEAQTAEAAKQLGWAEDRVRSVRAMVLQHDEAFGSWLQAEHRRTMKIERMLNEI